MLVENYQQGYYTFLESDIYYDSIKGSSATILARILKLRINQDQSQI